MSDKQMDQFNLADLPEKPAQLPDRVKQQVREIKASDARLNNAMDSVEATKENRINTTVFETENVKINAIGKVAGLNLKGRF